MKFKLQNPYLDPLLGNKINLTLCLLVTIIVLVIINRITLSLDINYQPSLGPPLGSKVVLRLLSFPPLWPVLLDTIGKFLYPS